MGYSIRIVCDGCGHIRKLSIKIRYDRTNILKKYRIKLIKEACQANWKLGVNRGKMGIFCKQCTNLLAKNTHFHIVEKESQKTIRARKGGKARANALTPERRSEIARIASNIRWKKGSK